jgi:AcrR family transcriptional regulator
VTDRSAARRADDPAARQGGGTGASVRERLTRDRVVRAALAVVDRDGLDGLTMRALGRELGVDPMAAYHHVPSKEAILQGVVEAILAELAVPDPSVRLGWREAARLIGHEYRRALLAHPNALPVVSTQPPLTPAGMRLIENAAAMLVRGGLAPRQALEVINGTAAAVIGSALVEAGVTPGGEAIEQSVIDSAYASLRPDEFPTITTVMATADPASFDPDRQFEDLLDALVRGFAARFRSDRPRAAQPRAIRR